MFGGIGRIVLWVRRGEGSVELFLRWFVIRDGGMRKLKSKNCTVKPILSDQNYKKRLRKCTRKIFFCILCRSKPPNALVFYSSETRIWLGRRSPFNDTLI